MGNHSKHLCFIDRANLHFKVGRHVSLEFTDVEKAFLKRMEETITFDDVIDLTKEIYEYARSINDHPDPIELPEELIEQLKELAKQQKSNPSQDEDEEDEDEGDGPVIEIPIDDEDEGEGQGEENEESEDKSKESPK